MDLTETGLSVSELRVAVLTLARELHAVSAKEGLTPTQTSVLSLLRHDGPLRATDIAVREGLNPSLVSRVLTQLGEAGYLVRERNAEDGRATDIGLSAEGQAISHRVRDQRSLWLTTRFEALPPEQQQALTSALPALWALADPGRT